MPSIRTTTRGGVIRWDRDDWYSGQSPFAQSSPASSGMTSPFSVIEGKGFAYSLSVDPYRHPGALSPGFTETALTNSSTVDATVTGTCNYLTDAYLVTNSAKIFHLDINANSFDASTYKTITATGTHGAHTSFVGCDAIYYKAKVAGTPTLVRFYSYNDNTDGDVARDNGGTMVWDFMSNTATGGAVLNASYDHPMIIGNNDILYIGNGSAVAAYDGQGSGTNGNFTAVALQLPSDYIINSFQNLPNYLVIYANKKPPTGGNYASESTVFLWDMVSADPTYKFNVDTYLITASFQYGSTVGCFGYGGSGSKAGGAGTVKLFMYDGTKFDLINNLPASVTGAVPRTGVVVLDETIYFTSTSGNLGASGTSNSIFSYGKDFKGKWSLNCVAVTTNSNASFLESFLERSFYTVGSTDVRPVKLSDNYFINAKFITPHVSPPLPSESRARIQKIKVGWAKTASTGNAFEITLVTNKGSNTNPIAQGIGVTPFEITDANMQNNYLRDVNGKALGGNFFESLAVQGEWTSGGGVSGIPPLLEFIEVYYTNCKI